MWAIGTLPLYNSTLNDHIIKDRKESVESLL